MRFDVLDSLRGICAVMVVLYHFSSNGFIADLPVVENGWLFVDYFFVLSGFVITHSYAARLEGGQISIGRFMGLRLGRIYPLHLFVLLAIAALELLLVFGGDMIARFVSRAPFTGSRAIEPLIQSLFLVQSFGIRNGAGWNGPAWSIAAEMWTYLLFAVAFVMFKNRAVLVSAVLSAAALLALISYSPTLHVTFNGGIFRCIFGFGLGVLTYYAFRRFGTFRGGSMAEIGAVAITVLFVSLASGGWTFLAPIVFAGMIFVLASQSGVVSHVLYARPLQFLGLTSYSIYMIHVFVQGRLGEVLQITRIVKIKVDADGRTLLQATPLVSDILTVVMLATVVGCAYITYRLIEKPGQVLSRRLLAPPRPAAPVDSAEP